MKERERERERGSEGEKRWWPGPPLERERERWWPGPPLEGERRREREREAFLGK